MLTTVMRLWWKGLLPTIVMGVLVIEMLAGGMFLLNQPQDMFVVFGVLMFAAIVPIVAVWAAWIRRSFFREQK